MAYFQSTASRRVGVPPAVAGAAGVTVTEIFTYTVPAPAPGAADFIEIGFLPAGNRIVGATLLGSGTGAATVTVGLLTGAVGDTADGSRAFAGATRLFPAATAVAAAGAAATMANALAQPEAARDQAIGIQPSAALTAGGTLTLVVQYVA